MSEVLSMLLQTASSSSTIIALIGVVSVILITLVFVTKIGDWVLPNPRETRVADFLPFNRLNEDGATIHLRNGSLARVFEVQGADTTLLLPEERLALAQARKQWIDSLSELEIIARVITLRERVNLEENEDTQKNTLLKAISTQWIRSLNRVFKNKHYIIITVNDRKNAMKDLDQASNALIAILSPYRPVLISERTPDDLPADSPRRHEDKSPLWVFAQMASPLSQPRPIITSEEGDALNSLLTADYIHFTGDEGIIRFFAGDKERYAICMGIRKPGDFMDEQLTADLLSIDFSLNLFHNIKPIPYVKANALLVQQRRMAFLTTFSQNVVQQYGTALEWMDNSDADGQTLNDYAMSIVIYGDSKEELQAAQDEVERLCRLHSVTPVREGWAAQAVFFAQFPTYDVYPRTFLYLSRVVACAICIDKTTEGHQKSDWAPYPISYFRTITGTAYAFQFHVNEEKDAVAHTALIGPTGQGKTTLFSFLAGQSLRIPDLNVYFFDRNNGAKVFATLLDAPYVKFDGGPESVSLNPFMIPDTSDNRAFLRRWLAMITGGKDAISEQEIARAVTTSYDYLRPEERLLKNLYKSCFAPNGYMRRELMRWIDNNQRGRIFNSESDNLEMDHRFMTFDFTELLKDEILAPAVISYIMHRINMHATLKGTPSLIMIDETAPMLENDMFKENFITGLREGRKKRQAYLCAFQQPRFLDDHGLGDVIRGQCQTTIFFKNPQANASDYESWNLTPREMNFILNKEWVDAKYAILVKRVDSKESVILDVNLSGLGPYLKVYSSGAQSVLLAERLRKQFADDNEFIRNYINAANAG